MQPSPEAGSYRQANVRALGFSFVIHPEEMHSDLYGRYAQPRGSGIQGLRGSGAVSPLALLG